MNFLDLQEKINAQFKSMSNGKLFRTGIDKDLMWETYLKRFPAGSNPILKERTVHDCQCCKQFIRACGDVISINEDLTLTSIWDIDITGPYAAVITTMSSLVRTQNIKDLFRHPQSSIGTKQNFGLDDTKYDHFYFDLPDRFVNKRDLGTFLSKSRADKDVFLRGLREISCEAIDTVLELLDQNTIYRGDEHRPAIEAFAKLHNQSYGETELDPLVELDNFAWLNASAPGARIRNTAIGTLLVDISEGMDLDKAVRLFESKMYGYKRPTAIISPMMIKKAQEKISTLGFTDSLPRRNAQFNDLTINNVLFADRTAKQALNVFDEMTAEVDVQKKNLDKVESVSIDTFINDILPKAEKVDLLFENSKENNLMSLVAPQYPDAPGMFKWNNNFSWSYNGEMADSMRDQVKALGGKVDGVLRFSIQWNEKGNNQIDFDAHCIEPDGNEIYFENKRIKHRSSGMLDVDIIHPGEKSAVENIIYTKVKKMYPGQYRFMVHNYSTHTSNAGFKAEIEFDGKIHTFEYAKHLYGNEFIRVADVNLNNNEFKLNNQLKSTFALKSLWQLPTNQFHKVSMIMNSPNHWDGNQTGNKHYFFILENCHSGQPVRGFYNEFLAESLTEHRKVFEVLGSKMKTEAESEQLSGLGFSSTKRASLVCKITGSFTRVIKINF